MKLQINGEERTLGEETTLTQLLGELGFAGKFVAVERNKEVVSYRNYDVTPLCDGDCLEIVTLVGGG